MDRRSFVVGGFGMAGLGGPAAAGRRAGPEDLPPIAPLRQLAGQVRAARANPAKALAEWFAGEFFTPFPAKPPLDLLVQGLYEDKVPEALRMRDQDLRQMLLGDPAMRVQRFRTKVLFFDPYRSGRAYEDEVSKDGVAVDDGDRPRPFPEFLAAVVSEAASAMLTAAAGCMLVPPEVLVDFRGPYLTVQAVCRGRTGIVPDPDKAA